MKIILTHIWMALYIISLTHIEVISLGNRKHKIISNLSFSNETKLIYKSINNHKSNLDFKTKDRTITSFSQDNNKYELESINTHIQLNTSSPHGKIKEFADFVLENGTFTNITKILSLHGSSDTLKNIKVSSYEAKLKYAHIIHNCKEPDKIPYYNHHYLCIISYFEPIQIGSKPKKLKIEYEYDAEDIIRKGTNNNNIIIYYYDSIEKINQTKMTFSFDNLTNIQNNSLILSYPDKYNVTKKDIQTNFSWMLFGEVKKISLELPLFNNNTRTLYDIRIKNLSKNLIQIGVWIVIAAFCIFIVIYLYVSENENKDNNLEYDEIDFNISNIKV